jgi:tetratricopeptide (TPR) repeat protein
MQFDLSPKLRYNPPVLRALPAVWLVFSLAVILNSATALGQTTEADVYVAQAVLDFDEKRYDAALENLRRALELEPDHVEALYFTGAVYAAQKRPDLAAPYLERARAKSPRDASIAYQLGLIYFAQQQYDKAQPLLEEAFKANSDLDGLGYYVGFLRYRNKDYRGALAAFRQGRSSDPEIQQLTRFYTGLALGVLGLPGQAAAEVEQAIRLAPGSQLTGPAERLRDTIVASRDKERRLSLEVRVGITWDDNVIVRPVEDDDAPIEPLVAEIRRHKHESWGELAGLNLNYVWWRTADWESSVGYSFFTTYQNEIPKFGVISNLATASLTYKTALFQLPTQVSLQYAFDHMFLGGDDFLKRHTVALSGVVIEGARHFTQGFVRFQAKDFADVDQAQRIANDNRSGNNYMAGFLHFVRFAEDRHYLKIGYQFDWDDTGKDDGRNWMYFGNRLSFGGQYTLPWWAVRLKYDLDVHFRDYTYKNTLLPTYAPGTKWRQDQEMTNIVRAELPLPRNFTLAAEYQVTRSFSNIEVFDYLRNVASVSIIWSY